MWMSVAQEDIIFVKLSTECAATTQEDITVLVWTGTYYRVITIHVWVSSTFHSCYTVDVPPPIGGNKSQCICSFYMSYFGVLNIFRHAFAMKI